MEEMISQNVLLSQAADGQVGRVIVAHRQPAVLAPGYEPVHSAAVDLMLLLEGAIHDVAGLLVRWNVPGASYGATGRSGGNRRSRMGGFFDVSSGCGSVVYGVPSFFICLIRSPALAMPSAPGNLPYRPSKLQFS